MPVADHATNAFRIDPIDGTIYLSTGDVITADLTREAFLAAEFGRAARPQDYGTAPWIHYHFGGGSMGHKPLLVSLCFHSDTLIYALLTADLEPEKPKDWSSYSLDTEAATKQLHDAVLERLFGPPTTRRRLDVSGFSEIQSTLAEPLTWCFRWGEVDSSHDLKGGGTSICVAYGDRLRTASGRSAVGRGSEPLSLGIAIWLATIIVGIVVAVTVMVIA